MRPIIRAVSALSRLVGACVGIKIRLVRIFVKKLNAFGELCDNTAYSVTDWVVEVIGEHQALSITIIVAILTTTLCSVFTQACMTEYFKAYTDKYGKYPTTGKVIVDFTKNDSIYLVVETDVDHHLKLLKRRDNTETEEVRMQQDNWALGSMEYWRLETRLRESPPDFKTKRCWVLVHYLPGAA